MSYEIHLTNIALEDIAKLKKSGNNAILKRIDLLIDELREHPYTGSGKIEKLKHFQESTYSRRINKEHRLVYQVYGEKVIVLVLSCYGHYK